MSEKSIIRLSQNPAGFGTVADLIKKNSVVTREPKQDTHHYFKNEALGIYVGVKESIEMIEKAAPYTCNAFITIVEGTAKIKNNTTGITDTFKAGESFVIPQGYHCQWHQQAYLRTFYLTCKAPKHLPNTTCDGIIRINGNNLVPWQNTSDGHQKKVLFQNHQRTFTAGIWHSKGFTTPIIAFPYHEFFTINQGALLCIDDKGTEHKFNAGESLFVPQGTRCAWHTSSNITLSFAQVKP